MRWKQAAVGTVSAEATAVVEAEAVGAAAIVVAIGAVRVAPAVLRVKAERKSKTAVRNGSDEIARNGLGDIGFWILIIPVGTCTTLERRRSGFLAKRLLRDPVGS